MKSSCLSLSKIYNDPNLHTLQAKDNFISSKRKRKWLTFENNLQFTQPYKHNSPGSKHIHLETEKQSTSGKTLSHSKWKSMELQDLKTKRYQQCKQDS